MVVSGAGYLVIWLEICLVWLPAVPPPRPADICAEEEELRTASATPRLAGVQHRELPPAGLHQANKTCQYAWQGSIRYSVGQRTGGKGDPVCTTLLFWAAAVQHWAASPPDSLTRCGNKQYRFMHCSPGTPSCRPVSLLVSRSLYFVSNICRHNCFLSSSQLPPSFSPLYLHVLPKIVEMVQNHVSGKRR